MHSQNMLHDSPADACGSKNFGGLRFVKLLVSCVHNVL